MIWAVVPAKATARAKERLAGRLSSDLRCALAHAMLTDVLDALGTVPILRGTIVVTADPSLAALAAKTGAVTVVEDAPAGVNHAVAAGIREAVRRDAEAVVVAMGDLPLLRGADVARLVSRLPRRGVVVAPSRDGTGTNLLALRPPLLVPTRFGLSSLARHRREAAERGLDFVVEPLPSAMLDVDTPADLDRLRIAAHPGTATRAVLGNGPLAAAATGGVQPRARGAVG